MCGNPFEKYVVFSCLDIIHCFLLFGYPDETLALVVHILLNGLSNKWMNNRAVRFQTFYLCSGFFGMEKPRFCFGYFQKRITVQIYIWTHLCMFRTFLLNRWIYTFVSLYKSLNILKEQLEFIYEHEIFLL
jgi:hypothetical protein